MLQDDWRARAAATVARADAPDAPQAHAWMALAALDVQSLTPAQYWHVMQTWTSEKSFLRSVWRVDVLGGGFGADAAAEGAGAAPGKPEPTAESTTRRWCRRRLQRKTPVPLRDAAWLAANMELKAAAGLDEHGRPAPTTQTTGADAAAAALGEAAQQRAAAEAAGGRAPAHAGGGGGVAVAGRQGLAAPRGSGWTPAQVREGC